MAIHETTTSDYHADCLAGRHQARDAVALVRETGNHAHLGGVVRRMVDAGEFGGIEAGFFAEISEAIADDSVNQG